MSDSRSSLLALIEEDDELGPIAPIFRAILETPTEALAAYLSLSEVWARLKGARRAMLVMTLLETLTVDEIARLSRVHRRTLYKSRGFKDARSRILTSQGRSLRRGAKSVDDSGSDFDAWEED